ncbi:hypothetical protein HMPREF9151_01603 [Hoylesella saccharolytica F0055]|uniref:Uncharacterized protein n=1 Tax=Hoylesella saccharolytica F0055 TaxID=1127699 RepID=L1N8F1_9BACT|nr:hypothetical protein HMPREF9151_01603 [Hoylesella saccharolytica F0055]
MFFNLQKYSFRIPKGMLLSCKTYAFTTRNLCFWKIAPYF